MDIFNNAEYIQHHRNAIIDRLGRDTINTLHKKSKWLDFLALPILLSIFAINLFLLNTLTSTWVFLLIFIAQGIQRHTSLTKLIASFYFTNTWFREPLKRPAYDLVDTTKDS